MAVHRRGPSASLRALDYCWVSLACVQVADVRDSRGQEERKETERHKQDEKRRGPSLTATSFTFAVAAQPPVAVAPQPAASRESSEFGFTTSPVSLCCRVYYNTGMGAVQLVPWALGSFVQVLCCVRDNC